MSDPYAPVDWANMPKEEYEEHVRYYERCNRIKTPYNADWKTMAERANPSNGRILLAIVLHFMPWWAPVALVLFLAA